MLAVAVLVFVNQPAEVTVVETSPVVLTAPGAAVVPMPETQAVRRMVEEGVAIPDAGVEVPVMVTERNHVIGTSLLEMGDHVILPPAPEYLPGDVADPHPLNHFAGTPR